MEKIKTYTLNWGCGDLILNEPSMVEYLTKGVLFSDDDIREEPQEIKITIEYKYTQEELDNLPEFNF